MSEVKVERISPDGLHKDIYEFTYKYGELVYTSYFNVNRSDNREAWADKRKPPMSFEKWCETHDRDEYDWRAAEDYREYKDSLNPVLQKTKQGKTKLTGISAQPKNMPKLPDGVAAEAVEKFKQNIKVRS